MKPTLEILEERAAPAATDWHIAEAAAPPNMNSTWVVEIDTDAALFLGQLHLPGLGLPYQGANQIIQWDVTPQQWNSIMAGYPPTTARLMVPAGTGDMPVILAPNWFTPQQLAPGIHWEETCFAQGWWDQDPPGVLDANKIGPGPDQSQPIPPVNFATADLLLLAGDPNWWLYAM